MYEPYGEEKKGFNLKEKISNFFNKIKSKFSSTDAEGHRTSKVTITLIALALLLTIGSITGYISYTGKINTLQSEKMLVERQNENLKGEIENLRSEIQGLNQQMSTCNLEIQTVKSNLESTKSELFSTQTQLETMTQNFEKSQNDLKKCNEDKLSLSADLNSVNEQLKKKKEEYNTLQTKYKNLQMTLDETICNYARDVCKESKFSMEYYFIENNEVFCCSKMDKDSCFGNKPDSTDEIKKINC
ncbi:MAG: hypothetical protein QXY45_00035 [Candidatus Aenigmatarchaeota archaeon]